MGKMLNTIGVGEILWDVLPGGKRLGGAPGNFVYHTKALGASATVISAIGNDKNGREIIKELRKKDISAKITYLNDKPTGTVDISINSQGEPDYIINEKVAWDFIPFDEDILQIIREADIICFGTLAQRNITSRETIQRIVKSSRPESLVVYDINLRQHYYSKEIIENSLQLCNVLKLNEDELPVLSNILEIEGKTELEKINKLINKFSLKLVAYTKGGEGSYLLTPSEKSYLDTPGVKIRDTIGAGDAFTAAMIVSYAKGFPLKKVHEKAVEVAAFVCTRDGAMPQYNNTKTQITNKSTKRKV
jgi:fructokinase